MNKKGQAGLAVIAAIMIFIIGISAVNLLKPEVISLRAADSLDCADTGGISDGNKLLCLGIGATIPWIIITIFSIAGGIVFTKVVGRKKT